MMSDAGMDMLIIWEIATFWQNIISSMVLLAIQAVNTLFQVFSNLWTNILPIIGFIILASIALVWLGYHNIVLEHYTVFRQCLTRPIIDFFLIPVFTFITMVYDTCIPVVNLYVNLHAFAYYGLPIVALKCAINIEIGQIFFYLAEVFKASMFDASVWFMNSPLDSEWTILNSLQVWGLWVDTLVPLFTCICKVVNPVYVALDLAANLPSLHNWLNCLWNVAIRIFQLCMVTLRDFALAPTEFPKPSFVNITLTACCVFKSFGDTIEDVIFICVELLFGLVGNTALPAHLTELLSAPYSHILTNPLCALAMVANVSATAVLNFENILKPDGTGVQFFQLGFAFDELRFAAFAFGALFALHDLFLIFNNTTQALVTQIGLLLIDIFAFLWEYLIGSLFYYMFTGPQLPHYPSQPFASFLTSPTQAIDNVFTWLLVYNPNYWIRFNVTFGGYTYWTALGTLIQELFLTAEALGDEFGLINAQLGCIIEHLLKVGVALIELAFNFALLFFNIITFQADLQVTMARGVDFDVLFNELYFLSGCLGGFIIQFDGPNPCQNVTEDQQHDAFCCTGGAITSGLDTIIIVIQQITHFAQDLISVPTGLFPLCILGFHDPTDPMCIRLPDFTIALIELAAYLCFSACSQANVFPIITSISQLKCGFPPPPTPEPGHIAQPPKTCGRITSCFSNMYCSVIQFIGLTGLQLLNIFFTQTLRGSFFSGILDFIIIAVTQVLNNAVAVILSYATLLDCLICILTPGTGHLYYNGTGSPPADCADLIFQFVYAITTLLEGLIVIFTTILVDLAKLFLQLIIGLFTGNPIKAIVTFIVNFAILIFGNIGSTIIQFLVSLFDSLGLGFIGTFLEALWKGFCPILQVIVNIIITVLKVITFGTIGIKYVNFCCSGGACTPSGGVNKRGEMMNFTNESGFIDGILYVTQDNWLYYLKTMGNLTFGFTDACNTSMEEYYIIPWPQTQIGNSTCDAMINQITDNDWLNLRLLEKRTIMDCLNARLYVDAFRIQTGLLWIPQDIWSNPVRKVQFLAEYSRGLLIYVQYFADTTVTSATYLSSSYQDNWKFLGLNTTFYERITTPDDILIARSRYHLVDYFEWNNASQYQAVVSTTTGFWSTVDFVLHALANTTAAFADNETNPMNYMTYSYSLNSPLGGAMSTLSSIISTGLQGIELVASFWSNPANLKRGEDATDKLYLGASSAYDLLKYQVNIMSLEWLREKKHISDIYAGKCDANETAEFITEYENSMKGLDKNKGNTSWVYQISQWWPRYRAGILEMKAYPVETRDGKSRGSANPSVYQYKDPQTGKIINETLHDRLLRFYSVAVLGTPESNSRVGQLSSIYYTLKDHFFGHVVKTNIRKFSNRYNSYTKSLSKAENDKIHQYTGFGELLQSIPSFINEESPSDYIDDNRHMMFKMPHESFVSSSSHSSPHPKPPSTDEVEHTLDHVITQKEHDNILLRKQLNDYIEKQKGSMDKVYTIEPKIENSKRRICNPLNENCHSHTLNGIHVYDEDELRDISYQQIDEEHGNEYPIFRMGSVLRSIDGIRNEQSKTVYKNTIKQMSPESLQYEHNKPSLVYNSRFLDSTFSENAIFMTESLISLTCTSNITFLCTECFYLDQLFTRVILGLELLVGYYIDGQYGASLNASYSTLTYVLDENSPVVFGDGTDVFLPFPSNQFSNWKWIGDDTPNKLRFNDYVDLINSVVNASNGNQFANSTLATEIDLSTINGIVLTFLLNVFSYFIQLTYQLISFIFNDPSSAAGDAENAGLKLVTDFVLCLW